MFSILTIKSTLIFTLFVLFTLVSCERNNKHTEDPVQLLPGINLFLRAHSEFGVVDSVVEMTNWANGKRQQVKTSKGLYLFYLNNGVVVSVYRNSSSGREEVWRKNNVVQ